MQSISFLIRWLMVNMDVALISLLTGAISSSARSSVPFTMWSSMSGAFAFVNIQQHLQFASKGDTALKNVVFGIEDVRSILKSRLAQGTNTLTLTRTIRRTRRSWNQVSRTFFLQMLLRMKLTNLTFDVAIVLKMQMMEQQFWAASMMNWCFRTMRLELCVILKLFVTSCEVANYDASLPWTDVVRVPVASMLCQYDQSDSKCGLCQDLVNHFLIFSPVAPVKSSLPLLSERVKDWNEFFCDPSRMVEGLLLQDGTRLFDLPHDRRFLALPRVDWQAGQCIRGAFAVEKSLVREPWAWSTSWNCSQWIVKNRKNKNNFQTAAKQLPCGRLHWKPLRPKRTERSIRCGVFLQQHIGSSFCIWSSSSLVCESWLDGCLVESRKLSDVWTYQWPSPSITIPKSLADGDDVMDGFSWIQIQNEML